MFDFGTQTWWEQTNYVSNGNSIQYATASSILPFDARVNVLATDYTYDQESWPLKITLESTYSTHANRRGSDDFTLELKDVCWDLPLTAPVMTASEYTLYLWDSNVS